MKLALVSCLLSLSLISSSQGSLEAIQQTMQYFEKEDYTNTIRVAEGALERVKREFGENSPFYSGMILFIGLSHFKLFHYEKAEPYFLKQLQLLAGSTGENTLDYVASLNGIALLYREMGKYDLSETQYIKALSIIKLLHGEKDTTYAKSVSNLASLYQFTGQYAKAEQNYIRARDIIKVFPGERSALYATCQNNLATLYSEMGQHQKAKTLMLAAVQLRKTVLGENHPDYAGALNNLASTLSSLSEYREAEKYFIQAGDIYRRTVGVKNPDYASSLNNLAELYKTTGEYEKAEQLYTGSMQIRKELLGENHGDYALSLNNLGGLYEISGRYEKAEIFFSRAKAIIEKQLGTNHPYYVTSLNNLAGLYHNMGQFAKAEPLYVQSRNIRKQMLGENHPSYAMSLNNLAVFYQEIGQFNQAEPLYLQAREIWKKSLGVNHPDYAMCQNNLAALYEDLHQFSKAEPLYLQARDIRKSVYGEDHNDYAASLNNIAGLYSQMGDFKKAEPLLLQAKDIWKRTMGENSPAYATSLNNLGALYRKAGIRYPESEKYYIQALDLRRRILGENHPYTADVQNDMALLYMNMRLPEKAAPLFIAGSQVTIKNLVNTFPVLSEKEKGNYISENLFFNECNSSFLYLFPGFASKSANHCLDLQLFFKSLSLSDTRNMLMSLRNSRDTAVKRILENWQNLKALLAKQYALPAAQRMTNLAQKEEEAENLEKDLSKRSQAFRRQQAALQVSMRDVQQQLGIDEAAIEFVSFRLYNKKFTDSIIYAAYVYRKQDSVATFIPLFEEQQLQRLLDSAGKSATGTAHAFYRGVEVKDRSNLNFGKDLYNLIWKPVEARLQGVKKIAYSPSGKLYGIAFHALPVDSSTLLMDKYEMAQYTSTRQVALRKEKEGIAQPKSITLFGNADFTMDSLELTRLKKNSDYIAAVTTTTAIAQRAGGQGVWPDLPGTAEEISRINELFRTSKLTTQLYVRQDASEENLKNLTGNSTQTLHIATHGFFLKDRSGKKESTGANIYSIAQDPLLRSGLILSGGNYAWSGKRPIEGVEDGIVTAYEISQLNLSGTDVVVLSACETALGDIKGNEGVFGLQRAFKMGGVKKIIVSLWQVPDKETMELMTSFYNYWIRGKTIEVAFSLAQAEMRRRYAPFFWAAFVMIE